MLSHSLSEMADSSTSTSTQEELGTRNSDQQKARSALSESVCTRTQYLNQPSQRTSFAIPTQFPTRNPRRLGFSPSFCQKGPNKGSLPLNPTATASQLFVVLFFTPNRGYTVCHELQLHNDYSCCCCYC